MKAGEKMEHQTCTRTDKRMWKKFHIAGNIVRELNLADWWFWKQTVNQSSLHVWLNNHTSSPPMSGYMVHRSTAPTYKCIGKVFFFTSTHGTCRSLVTCIWTLFIPSSGWGNIWIWFKMEQNGLIPLRLLQVRMHFGPAAGTHNLALDNAASLYSTGECKQVVVSLLCTFVCKEYLYCLWKSTHLFFLTSNSETACSSYRL